MFGAEAFKNAFAMLIIIGIVIGLLCAGAIWGLVVLFSHISIIWK